MKIAKILEEKGHGATRVRPEVSLGEIARIMRKNRIGSVLVENAAGQTIGLVSERAIVEAMAAEDACANTVLAASLMVAPAPSIDIDADVYTAMKIMTNTRNRHLVVLDGGSVRGVVSVGDLVKVRMRDMELENNVLRDIARAKLTG